MKDFESIINTINESKVFKNLTSGEKANLAQLGTLYQYEKGHMVFSSEHHGDAFYLVLSGVLKIRLRNQKTKICRSGEVVGEVAIFDNRTRSGTIHVQETAILAKFEKEKVFHGEHLTGESRANIIAALTKQITSYLFEDLPVSTKELIMHGESERIEFKQSASKSNFPKIVETIAAMLNSHGGTILLGIEDGGGLVGLRLNSTSRNVLVLSLNQQIRAKLGEFSATLVEIDAEKVDGCEIIRIDCEPSPSPVFFLEKGEELLFVRTNRENMQIRKLADSIRFLKNHFKEISKV